jgi:hypothetical protein
MRDHCCDQMRGELQVVPESRGSTAPDRPVSYDPVFDEYRLAWHDSDSSGVPILHCPWCGRRLPDSKRDQWYTALQALGLGPDDPRLPERFHGDTWWRD